MQIKTTCRLCARGDGAALEVSFTALQGARPRRGEAWRRLILEACMVISTSPRNLPAVTIGLADRAAGIEPRLGIWERWLVRARPPAAATPTAGPPSSVALVARVRRAPGRRDQNTVWSI